MKALYAALRLIPEGPQPIQFWNILQYRRCVSIHTLSSKGMALQELLKQPRISYYDSIMKSFESEVQEAVVRMV